jgi:hypothetical protein
MRLGRDSNESDPSTQTPPLPSPSSSVPVFCCWPSLRCPRPRVLSSAPLRLIQYRSLAFRSLTPSHSSTVRVLKPAWLLSRSSILQAPPEVARRCCPEKSLHKHPPFPQLGSSRVRNNRISPARSSDIKASRPSRPFVVIFSPPATPLQRLRSLAITSDTRRCCGRGSQRKVWSHSFINVSMRQHRQSYGMLVYQRWPLLPRPIQSSGSEMTDRADSGDIEQNRLSSFLTDNPTLPSIFTYTPTRWVSWKCLLILSRGAMAELLSFTCP